MVLSHKGRYARKSHPSLLMFSRPDAPSHLRTCFLLLLCSDCVPGLILFRQDHTLGLLLPILLFSLQSCDVPYHPPSTQTPSSSYTMSVNPNLLISFATIFQIRCWARFYAMTADPGSSTALLRPWICPCPPTSSCQYHT